MAHKFAEIAFTPTVRAVQLSEGSRAAYARMDVGEDYNHRMGDREADFISLRDSLYLASVSETGWPYVQHRGGPVGFVKVLDDRTIGFADYGGNRQYVSTGNFRTDNRVALFFMDYPNRTRLKMLGRVRTVGLDEPEVLVRLEDLDYPAQVERGFVITVEAFDWNCPQHITPRFTEAEFASHLPAASQGRNYPKNASETTLDNRAATDRSLEGDATVILGEGPMELVVSGIRQLAPRVRAFELRDPNGGELPALDPGSHLKIPVLLPSGGQVVRHYSVASNPLRRDIYEIAVLNEEEGSGGSRAVHDNYHIGMRLRLDMPGNHFAVHEGQQGALLIAGGIGITPIKSMAQFLSARGVDFQVHYAGRSRVEMAYLDRLQHQLGGRLSVYSAADGQRLDVARTLATAMPEHVIYVCGPPRLIAAVKSAADALGISRERVRVELFA